MMQKCLFPKTRDDGQGIPSICKFASLPRESRMRRWFPAAEPR